MSRYFVNSSQINEDVVDITGEDYQHLKKVLRAQKGDIISICCEGYDYTAEIIEITGGSVKAGIVKKEKNLTEPALKVILYQGLPKSDKMELIIQKCVEIGVTAIIPVITDRCVSRINADKDAQNKLMRWQKIASEAAKQCNRGIIPNIGAPVKFREAIEQARHYELSIIPYEKENAAYFKKIAAGYRNITSASIFIGPEGGFTEDEIQLAEIMGIKKLTLGPRILRTETAGFVALSLMMYELGDVSSGTNKICSC